MDRFFADAVKSNKKGSQNPDQHNGDAAAPKYPKGVVLGEDGKP